jgi:hypothetical protein
MKKQIRLLAIIVAISAAAVSTIIVLRPTAQTLPKNKLPEDDAPTKLQNRIMSDEQKQHGKLFRHSEKERSLIRKGGGDITTVIGEPWEDVSSSSEGHSEIKEYLEKMACSSDLVILGKVLAKTSQLTEDDKSIFTDYQVELEQVFKSRANRMLKQGDVVTITRSGGAVELDGRIIRVYDKTYKALRHGKTYVLFLKFDSSADTFIPTDRDGTFSFENEVLNPYNDIPSRFSWQRTTQDALRNIIDNLELPCSK